MLELIIAADANTPKKDAAPAPAAQKNDAAKSVAKVGEQQSAVQKQGADGKEKTIVKTTTVQNDGGKAQQQREGGGSAWLQMLPFILIFVVMIFFMNRSQKKQMQKRQEMLDKITKGAKVLLSSGIYGTVDAVQEDAMIVEIASGVKVKVAKAGIADVVTNTESGKTEGK